MAATKVTEMSPANFMLVLALTLILTATAFTAGKAAWDKHVSGT